jgi:hypothetical protein
VALRIGSANPKRRIVVRDERIFMLFFSLCEVESFIFVSKSKKCRDSFLDRRQFPALRYFEWVLRDDSHRALALEEEQRRF